MEQITIQMSIKEAVAYEVEALNIFEAVRLREDGYTNECFFNPDGSLTDSYKVTFKEKPKYFYINFGTSGIVKEFNEKEN